MPCAATSLLLGFFGVLLTYSARFGAPCELAHRQRARLSRDRTCYEGGGRDEWLEKQVWRNRYMWALGRVCTTQPGVSCGVCHKCRASAEARRRSGCVGGIARGIEVLRVHGVGRRGTRGAVSLCAPHSPAQAVAHRFVRSGSHGAAGGSRTALRRWRSPRLRIAVCVCVIAGLRPRGSERAHRGSGCALG
jgi:hypothetical protein